MFTGIIKFSGIVQNLAPKLSLIVPENVFARLSVGDSLSVDGVCLTVANMANGCVNFDVINETLELTTLHNLQLNDKVNLEFPLSLSDFLSGHLLTGHIDFVSELQQIDGEKYVFSLSAQFNRFVALKGSIAVNGVSLTVNAVTQATFTVNLVPSTLSLTNLINLKIHDKVNVEVDLIARYLDNLRSQ